MITKYAKNGTDLIEVLSKVNKILVSSKEDVEKEKDIKKEF